MTKSNGTTRKCRKLQLSVPVATWEPDGYCSERVDINMNHSQAKTMRRLVEGLKADGIILKSGRAVRSNADAVRYLCELIDEKTTTKKTGAATVSSE